MVTSAPHENKTATVIELAKAILAQGHQINGMFFYQNGVLNAASLLAMPSDEFQSCRELAELASVDKVPMHLCITAAEKRGLTDDDKNNILPYFTVSGLGEMVELTNQADKVIQL